ncbi:MAG: hypothetical protein ABI383_13690 [Acidobacteriaceae bacterium]
MQIELTGIGLGTQRAIGAGILLGLLGFCGLAVRDFRGQSWLHSSDPSGLERSAAIEPRNSDVWDALADTELFAGQHAEAARADLRRAIVLNPHDSRYWLDLSMAERLLGDSAGERQAMASAVAADPTTPDVNWQAATLALADGDTLAALHRFRSVAQFDPDKAVAALDLCWRATEDIALLIENAVPPDGNGYAAMLAVLLQEHRLDAVEPWWDAALEKHIVIPTEMAVVAANSLLLSHRGAEALHIWHGIAEHDPAFREYLRRDDNLMVNPGFESELIDTGFDWHFDSADGVRVEIASEARSGKRSLRFEFAAARVADPGVAQYVPVSPGRIYRVGFYAKTEELLSAGRLHLLVEDADTGAPLYYGDEIDNSSFWKEHAGVFRTAPHAHLLRIHLVRTQSALLISGRLWLDDFSLAEAPAK